MKICNKCKIPLDEEDFHRDNRKPDGRRSICKKCMNSNNRSSYNNNIDKERKRSKLYYHNNKEEINKKHSQYYKEHYKNVKYIHSLLYGNSYCKVTPFIKENLLHIEDFKIVDGYLFVCCKHCGGWYQPMRNQVYRRISNITGRCYSENNFYCSDICKDSCNIFNRNKYPRYHKEKKNSNNIEWVKLVKERDNHTCQICGSIKYLESHHIIPVAINPLLAEDLDNGICLCKDCHKKVHRQKGCRYKELKELNKCQ